VPARISHIPFYERMIVSDGVLLAAASAYALPLTFLLLWKPMLGIAFAVAPIVLFIVSHGPTAIFMLIAATFLYLPFQGEIALLPADVAAMVLVAAYVVDLLGRGASPRHNPLARPFFAYLAIAFLSIALEGFTGLSVRFFLRQVLLVITFLAVAHFGQRVNAKQVLILFVAAANLNSLYAIVQYMAAGGGIRAFGLAGHGYADHAMLAFIIAAVFYLWSDDLRVRWYWGISALIMVAAMAAAQTRASVITAGWAVTLATAYALWQGHRGRQPAPFKNLMRALVLAALIVPVLAFYTPVFSGIANRLGQIGWQASGTILLRFTLWKAALAAFLDNPVLGIGAGNFPRVDLWVPAVRFDPVFYLVSGLSTHAIIMTALAETGILGLCTMTFFLWRAVRVSYRHVAGAVTTFDRPVTLCLFIIALIVFGSSIYAGAWFWGNNSYHMAIFFGLIASYRNRPTPIATSGESA
jgi:O-antigen ligase